MTVSVKAPTSTTGSIQLNGSDVLTIDSSGNLTAPNNIAVNGNLVTDTNTFYVDATNNRVGIGTASPSHNLQVYSASNPEMRLGDATVTYQLYTDGSTAAVTGTVGNHALVYRTNATERMRIDSSGYLLHACTSQDGNASTGIRLTPDGSVFATRNNEYAGIFRRSSSDGGVILFRRDANNVGSISVTTSATAYNTSSDYRLKNNVAPMSGSIDRLKQLKPSTWTWIHGGNGEGFLAHEAQTVVPEAVTGTKDAMRTEEYEVTPAVTDDEGNVTTAAVMGTREVPDYQGIDQSKLVPLLTAALQEAINKIEDLETRIQALESA